MKPGRRLHAAFFQKGKEAAYGPSIKENAPAKRRVAEERACGDYVCKYCGGKATACNFVADMCLQVYARHQGMCGAYIETEKYVGYVTDCSTCHYQGISGECRYEGRAAMGQGV